MQYAEKVVFAGDHMQLAPLIKSKTAAKLGLSDTLFEQVIRHSPKLVRMLKIQHRMNENIMFWSSECMYKGELVAAPSVADQLLGDSANYKVPKGKEMNTLEFEDQRCFLSESLFCIDTSSCNLYESEISDSFSKYNIGEAGLVKLTVNKLKRLGMKDDDIGVITPYRAQVNIIRKFLTDDEKWSKRSYCDVSTVDGFQGREKEVIIISMVRSNDNYSVGFLSDERRLNVAITRAMKLCIIIGDSYVVRKTRKEDKKNMWKVDQCTFYDNHNNFLTNMYRYFKRFGEWRNAIDYFSPSGSDSPSINYNRRRRYSDSSQSSFSSHHDHFEGGFNAGYHAENGGDQPRPEIDRSKYEISKSSDIGKNTYKRYKSFQNI